MVAKMDGWLDYLLEKLKVVSMAVVKAALLDTTKVERKVALLVELLVVEMADYLVG